MPIPANLERDAAELRDKINQHRAAFTSKKDAADKLVEAEKKAGRNPLTGTSDDDRDSFNRIDAAYKEADTEAETAAELERRLHALFDMAGHEARDVSGGDPAHPVMLRVRTAGQIVVGSEQYDRLLRSGALTQSAGRVPFDPVQVLSTDQTRQFLARGVFLADAGDGTPLVPSDERLVPPVEIPKRAPTVLDMITVSTTGRDAVTWSRQTARTTGNMDTVAFGSVLNKSRYTYETVSSPVYRRGHYAVVDEGNIADQGEFRGIIDNELVTDLRVATEDFILQGPGTTDWEGIYNTTGIGEIDASTAENRADALHKAITTVRVALEREPSAWGISPTDFEEFYLEKDDFGRYLHNRGPLESPLNTIWGLPAMVSTGYARPLVGAWARGATLWVREGITVLVDRIDDQFIEGLWTIRAQFRGAFAVRQPKAFCEVTSFAESS